MTTFEWAMVSLTALGFLVTVRGVLGGCVWAVAKIKTDVDKALDAILANIRDMRAEIKNDITALSTKIDALLHER
jgi:hypothetical protein